jgi:flagellar biosynthesis protein FlhF
MKQKLYRVTGATLDEAHNAVRARFGDDAIVLNTRHVPYRGLLGWLGRGQVELTVSISEPVAAPRARTALERRYAAAAASPHAAAPATAAPPASAPTGATPLQTAAVQANTAADSRKELEALLRSAQERMKSNISTSAPAMENTVAAAANAQPENLVQFPAHKTGDTEGLASLKNELREIRAMMQVLYAENPGAGLPSEFAPHYRALLARGVCRKMAAALIGAVVRECEPAVLRDERVFRERLAFEIRRAVRVTGGIALQGGSCRRIAICGATGVGKTTTIAKLAGQFCGVRERARVALITADTYRIAATEQLRTYANIMGVPLAVADEPAAMRKAVRDFADYDLVLIDTAGGSQFNLEQINELKVLLQSAQPHETMLAVSAGTPLEDMRDVLRNFLCLSPGALLFTKIDETRHYGAMLSLLWESGLPLSYLSIGQNVPDDITVATGGKLAQLIAATGGASNG